MSLLSKLAGISRSDASCEDARDAVRPHLRKPNMPVQSAAGTSALMIACPDPTTEDIARDKHRVRGQFLARQDMWENLSEELLQADTLRLSTPSGMPASELLSYGARSDVVMAVEHALLDGKPDKGAPLMAGIEGLEEMLADANSDPMCAIVVAQAHMDLGWAWRGTGNASRLATRNREAFEAHFDRACDILDSVESGTRNSTFFQSARCALNGAGLNPQHKIALEYERLIDLDPKNPGPMRALGTYMSPDWFGSHEELELAARRVAGRTQSVWGAGGYTWVMFDVLAGDPVACANLEVVFFVEGLNDILERQPDQHTVNLLAAFCAHATGGGLGGLPRADANCSEIAACANWIVRKHLTELHPMIWAHAAAGFANNINISSPRRFAAMGQRDGLKVIAHLFHREIAQGRRIIFTADGPVAEPC